jgi:hypothetical protein
MTVAATIRQELENDFLSAIGKGQDIALGARKPRVQAVRYVIAAVPVVRVPLARLPRTAHEAAAQAAAQAAKAPRPQAGPSGGSGGNPQFPALPCPVVRDEGGGP